jgi:hypothetical protein
LSKVSNGQPRDLVQGSSGDIVLHAIQNTSLTNPLGIIHGSRQIGRAPIEIYFLMRVDLDTSQLVISEVEFAAEAGRLASRNIAVVSNEFKLLPIEVVEYLDFGVYQWLGNSIVELGEDSVLESNLPIHCPQIPSQFIIPLIPRW